METFLHRYELDPTRPTGAQVRRDLALRAFAPALGLWAVIVGIGLLITGPAGDLPGELAVNEWFVTQRTPALDAITAVTSNIGATLFIISACLVAVVVLWWRTRQWWFAPVPALAIGIQAAVFVTSALVVGRDRPDVELLDDSPPTSSFPSGHTGASTAFYLTLAMLAQRITHPVLRWSATVVCVAVPILVGTSRMYRGMHHLTDVLVGALNGLVCAWLAWRYLRRDVDAVRGDQASALGQTRA
ncbi:MAG: phosphatase PAP2 family protein [Cellulomonadaceae bacterium]|nr:phosphatase PAP2 family protein [Cellulomonadaceae bacterium]